MSTSASNSLYRGETQGFAHAMRLVIEQCDYELSLIDDLSLGDESNKIEREVRQEVERMKAAAAQALAEYQAVYDKAMTPLFQRFASSSDENLKLFGQAALSGDFSQLAI